MTLPQEILDNAQILWDYMKLNQPLQKADCILAMGSHDLRVAEYAAHLQLQGWAPMLICSGGYGNFTRGKWPQPEADMFAQVAITSGVAHRDILVENESANTGENVLFTRKLIERQGLDIHSFLLVHKPYMERRAYATFRKLWLEKDAIVSSPPISLTKYPTEQIPMEEVINIMVGDFQRILVYPEHGYQIAQDVPEYIRSAYQKLVQAGFDKHLLAAQSF